MTAQTEDRPTPRREGVISEHPVKSGELIYAGSIVSIDSDGFAVSGTATVGDIVLGCAQNRVDNLSSAHPNPGPVKVHRGIHLFHVDGTAITAKDIHATVYVVDDQTVSLADRATGGTAATRPAAGVVFDEGGTTEVWVQFLIAD